MLSEKAKAISPFSITCDIFSTHHLTLMASKANEESPSNLLPVVEFLEALMDGTIAELREALLDRFARINTMKELEEFILATPQIISYSTRATIEIGNALSEWYDQTGKVEYLKCATLIHQTASQVTALKANNDVSDLSTLLLCLSRDSVKLFQYTGAADLLDTAISICIRPL